ncbi:hypothetical protein DDR33_01040 [Pararcticibacter amylolyticus]|uniref:Uncharacterized protein n=2 Tax=Pararcticibacter amylolyticus TaxID=2173175 RepID=A0A2U2PMI2_9SPHI|nr:hypothetical protein DDR33_01040 [Pararcticibacter amylolyticus]
MFLRLTAILLIPLMIGVSFSRMLVYAAFELNRNYIASTLCENRERPWLHCDGKCYLAKKMKQVEEKEKNEERQTQKNLIQDSFLPVSFPVVFTTRLLRVIEIPYNKPVITGYPSIIYQPPRA